MELRPSLKEAIQNIRDSSKGENHQYFTPHHLLLSILCDTETLPLLKNLMPVAQLKNLVDDVTATLWGGSIQFDKPADPSAPPKDTVQVREIYDRAKHKLAVASRRECSGADMLSAIIDHGQNPAAAILGKYGVTQETLARHATFPAETPSKKVITMTPSASLERAVESILRLGAEQRLEEVAPEDLLLSLINSDPDVLAVIEKLTSISAVRDLKDQLMSLVEENTATAPDNKPYSLPKPSEELGKILTLAMLRAYNDGRGLYTGKDFTQSLLRAEENQGMPTRAGKILKNFLKRNASKKLEDPVSQYFNYGAKMPQNPLQEQLPAPKTGDHQERTTMKALPYFDTMKLNDKVRNVIATTFENAKTFMREEVTALDLLQHLLLNDKESREIVRQCANRSETPGMDQLDRQIASINSGRAAVPDNQDPVPSEDLIDVMNDANSEMMRVHRTNIEGRDIIAAILLNPDTKAGRLLTRMGIAVDTVRDIKIKPYKPATEASNESYFINLNERAEQGKIDPVIGRDQEIEKAVMTLSRRRKSNPLLVGEPGVGKTAIAEGLASMIVNGNVPAHLSNATIYTLDMGALTAGTKYRGDFEARMKKVIKHFEESPDDILFIDEIHTILGAGSTSDSALDASNLLKPALAKGLKCIGATTFSEYRKYFEKDEALSRRFQKISIAEPSAQATIEILKGLRDQYEAHHDVQYSDEAVEAAVKLSVRYINDRFLPDKAIDLLDQAGAAQKILPIENRTQVIGAEQIEKIVAELTNRPPQQVSQDDKAALKELGPDIKTVVFGQDPAINALTTAVKTSRAGLGSPQKPVGSFLFTGPTGVGKTEVAKQLAASLNIPLIRFDMSEYMEQHTVSRLIGAPPGYVGYDQGGLLTEAVNRAPYSVLLLDELEKAHPSIFNILLQVMDYGTLTDNNGKKADFRNVILIMTSNAGAAAIEQRKSIGFTKPVQDEKRHDVQSALTALFTPEFRNRLDAIIQFNPLNPEILKNVTRKFTKELEHQLKEKSVTATFTEAALGYLTEKGFDPRMGARPMQRVIQQEISTLLADELLFGKLQDGGKVTIDFNQAAKAIEIECEASAPKNRKSAKNKDKAVAPN